MQIKDLEELKEYIYDAYIFNRKNSYAHCMIFIDKLIQDRDSKREELNSKIDFPPQKR